MIRLSGDIDVLVHSLPRETRIKVLDPQLTQGAHRGALVQNRLDSETKNVKICRYVDFGLSK